jgi:hypothetical protein
MIFVSTRSLEGIMDGLNWKIKQSGRRGGIAAI